MFLLLMLLVLMLSKSLSRHSHEHSTRKAKPLNDLTRSSLHCPRRVR